MVNKSEQRIEQERIVLHLLKSEDLANLWWNSPNRAFDMQHPNNADIDAVSRYLYQFLEYQG